MKPDVSTMSASRRRHRGRHAELVSASIYPGAVPVAKRTLKRVQGDGKGGVPVPGTRSCQSGFSLSIRLIFH